MSAKKETTHILSEGELVLYRRERSSIWQCRYKVGGVWQRASTKERKLKDAKEVAKELRITAEIRKRDNLPVITRKFRDVAKLAVQRMEQKLANGDGKVSYKDYIRIINEYLIPILGNRLITNIDSAALDHLDAERIRLMERQPSHSTLLSHNAALNLIFDEGVLRNFLTELNRPKLESKGKKSTRHPAFELNEIQAVINNFDSWIERARNDHSKEMRQIMRDYVVMLIDTGARPGKELMNLKWKQIRFSMTPTLTHTGQKEFLDDGTEQDVTLPNLNRIVEMTVSGKTGTRQIIGREPTVKVLERISRRVYGVRNNVADPLKDIAIPSNDDYVLRTKDKKQDVSSSCAVCCTGLAFGWFLYCEVKDIGAMVDATRTAAIAAAAKAGAVNSTQTSVTPLLDILASWKIGAYILLVTLVFWFIRLLVRLFLSNIHLENDAAERVTMAKTYIALMRDGTLNGKEHVGTILAALFRPTGDGIVKDEGLPPTAMEWLTKLSGKN